MNQEIIISVENIKKSYGGIQALSGINFQVAKGAVFGLLGPNGAGKTTLIKILTTLTKADEGRVIIEGINLNNHPALIRTKIGLAGQFAAVDENLTGRENLEMIGMLYHVPRLEVKKRIQKLLEEFSLTEFADRLVKTYSGGMRKRIDIALSLIGEPKILFLDEPTTGLDPKNRMDLWETIKKLSAKNTTVFLTTQYLQEADYLANYIVIIDRGKVTAQGTPLDLKTLVGGGIVQIHPTNKKQLNLLGQFLISYNPHIDISTGTIIIKSTENAKILPNILRIIDTAKIEISDIEFRKPTLDEVFLALTGKNDRKL